jgi:L-ascorbate metabolism protein UlaG (beta-lactamase superfamily)
MAAPFPVSDHCDGRRFYNPTGPGPRSFSDLPKWWWQRWRDGVRPWPAQASAPRPVQLPATISAGHVAATFIGHATFLLQFPGLTVLTDPVFAHRAGPFGVFGPPRVRPPALALDALPPVDLVLLSHNHYDHLDLAALRWLARHRRPRIVAPLGLGAWLAARGVGNTVELDWWQELPLGAGGAVVCTPAQHWSSRGPWDRCRTLWAAFRVNTPDGSAFYGADSGWGPHFAVIGETLGACDLALLPVGAYAPRWFMAPVHLDPAEAVLAHRAVRARRSVAMHYGTFQLTDEPLDEPLQKLAEARAAHGVPDDEFVALDFGETRRFRLGGAPAAPT